MLVDDRTGAVEETWTGFQVAWTMARGYPGAFGRTVNAPWVWIPLCVLFVLPFARPPLRLLHLDLLVLLAFSVSYAFFNAARDRRRRCRSPIRCSVYLLARMLWIVARRPRAPRPPRAAGRAAGVLLDRDRLPRSASGVGAQRHDVERDRRRLLGRDRRRPARRRRGRCTATSRRTTRTATPTARSPTRAYVPFERCCRGAGRWDDLPAAHAAAIAFDLLTAPRCCSCSAGGCAGPSSALLLAYLWVTFPFTLLVAELERQRRAGRRCSSCSRCSSRARPAARGGARRARGADEVRAARARAAARGARRGRAALPAARASPRARGRRVARAGAGRPRRTAGTARSASRPDRDSPFSIWGYYGCSGALQDVAQVAAVALALARRRSRPAPATTVGARRALAAAVLIALQLARRPLVLPLPRVVRPAGAGRAAGRRSARGTQDARSTSARRGADAPDQDAHEPRVVVGGLVAHRHLRAHDRDRLLLA